MYMYNTFSDLYLKWPCDISLRLQSFDMTATIDRGDKSLN